MRGCGRPLTLLVAIAITFSARGVFSASEAPVDRIDRMWVVGAPPLDAEPTAGIYAWLDRRKLAFAVAPKGDGRARVYQWTVQARGLALVDGGDCKIAARSRGALVLAARPVHQVVRCQLEAEGTVTLSRFRVGRRSSAAFVGPLARPAARQVRIGAFGRKARDRAPEF